MVRRDMRSESDKSPASRELDRRSRQQAEVARLGVLALSGIPLADLVGEALRSLRTHLGAPLAAMIPLDGESARLVDEKGGVDYLNACMADGIVTDITAQLEAAESVAASERFFRSMIE